MKNSVVAEAIEQDLPAPTYTYTIRGHSDDIIEIDGPDTDGGIEAYSDRGTVNLTFMDSTSAGRIHATLIQDQWAIGIAPFNDHVPLPIGSYTLSAEGYTAVLTITTPNLLTFREDNVIEP